MRRAGTPKAPQTPNRYSTQTPTQKRRLNLPEQVTQFRDDCDQTLDPGAVAPVPIAKMNWLSRTLFAHSNAVPLSEETACLRHGRNQGFFSDYSAEPHVIGDRPVSCQCCGRLCEICWPDVEAMTGRTSTGERRIPANFLKVIEKLENAGFSHV